MAHLNTQSLPSSFDEFSYMMNRYKFDIAALRETWLKDIKSQLEYVLADGYKSEFKNRVKIRRFLQKRTYDDLEKTDGSIVILWIEVQGRNTNTLVLIGAVYQPSTNETRNIIINSYNVVTKIFYIDSHYVNI